MTISTVALASALPLIVGVVLLVVLPLVGAVTIGAGGGVVSTVKLTVVELGDVLFEASVAVA